MKNYLTKLFVVATTFISVISAQHNLEVIGFEKEKIRLSNDCFIRLYNEQEGMLDVGDKLEFSENAFDTLINYDCLFPVKSVKFYCERLQTELKAFPQGRLLESIKIKKRMYDKEFYEEFKEFYEEFKEFYEEFNELGWRCFRFIAQQSPDVSINFVVLEDDTFGVLFNIGDEEEFLGRRIEYSKYFSLLTQDAYIDFDTSFPTGAFVTLGKIQSEITLDGMILDSILEGTVVEFNEKKLKMLIKNLEKTVTLHCGLFDEGFDLDGLALGNNILYFEVDFSHLNPLLDRVNSIFMLLSEMLGDEIFEEKIKTDGIIRVLSKVQAFIFAEELDFFEVVKPINSSTLDSKIQGRL